VFKHLFLHLDIVTWKYALPCANHTSPPVIVAVRLLEHGNDISLLKPEIAGLISLKVEQGYRFVLV
jgi:hypothetical protein